jgi:thioredoxin 1
MAELTQVNDQTFEAEVLKSELPVLVDFWAPWCAPCRMLGPVIEGLAAKYQGKLKVVKMSTDDSPDTPRRYNVQGIPTLILFKAGQETERHVGFAAESALADKLNPHLT